ncbi:competence/damage-inducible protein A [Saprospiraceae bacterium]|jgi:nicotinamide-nucleotide amidase|nr:competence/damage-inducible protein A [Bacteroidota bacterium]MDB4727752.1 competence/damage-inducible protein A [Saprospiraceae bacterium]MDF1863248.1 competence/damage-inducible protein A [Saprospiraceae bacterium]
MNVHIVTIGDEILIGQIVDTNSAWMAQQLNLIGAQVIGITTVADTDESILEGLKNATENADVVLMTGGLGPTKDDITKKTLAGYFKTGLVFHQKTWERIVRLFERRGRTWTEAHREQCFMPQNATIFKNKMGTAPGMWFEENGKVYVSMPGVPYEMKYLMEYEVMPRLKEKFPGKPIAHRTILTVGEGESRLAKRMERFEKDLPKNLKLAYLPGLGQVRLRISGTGDNEQILNAHLDEKVEEVKTLIPEFIFGFGTDKLEAAVGRVLNGKELTIATAESCTGGFLAHKITSISGSSAYFMGSVLAYSNEVKMNQLSVKEETLKAYGAVSEETVREMVGGILSLLKTDIGVATSGIAGPSGGTEEKPVGTVWIAVGNREKIITRKLIIGKDRLKNIEYSTVQALNMVREFVIAGY